MSTWREIINYGVFYRARPLSENFYGRDFLEYIDLEHALTDRELFSSITNDKFKIKKVVKVNNPYLYGLYLLCKEELELNRAETVKECMLYHATSKSNAKNIARHNIDWRLTSRSRFGQGACFSHSPRYAHRYSRSNEAFLICKVLVKNAEKVCVNYGLQVPSSAVCDTAEGNDGFVTVKFDDFNFYPQYIVYYV